MVASRHCRHPWTRATAAKIRYDWCCFVGFCLFCFDVFFLVCILPDIGIVFTHWHRFHAFHNAWRTCCTHNPRQAILSLVSQLLSQVESDSTSAPSTPSTMHRAHSERPIRAPSFGALSPMGMHSGVDDVGSHGSRDTMLGHIRMHMGQHEVRVERDEFDHWCPYDRQWGVASVCPHMRLRGCMHPACMHRLRNAM